MVKAIVYCFSEHGSPHRGLSSLRPMQLIIQIAGFQLTMFLYELKSLDTVIWCSETPLLFALYFLPNIYTCGNNPRLDDYHLQHHFALLLAEKFLCNIRFVFSHT